MSDRGKGKEPAKQPRARSNMLLDNEAAADAVDASRGVARAEQRSVDTESRGEVERL